MKTAVIFIAFISALAVLCFAAGEDIDTYEYLYNAAQSNLDQLEILQNMAGLRFSGAGEFYSKALKRLLFDYKNLKGETERSAAKDQAMLLASLLGAEKYTQSAPDIWAIIDGFEVPLVKSEAMIALGRIRAKAYLPQVIHILENINVMPTTDRLEGERLAFGAIIALEKFQDPSGYLPVFFASVGWYSKRIQEQALKSLDLIAEDPLPFMLDILDGMAYDYNTKYAVVKAIETSKRVSNAKKAGFAVVGYTEGWKIPAIDLHSKVLLADMRKLAIHMVNKYKPDDEAIYPLLERSYIYGDVDEKFAAVSALASQRTEAAAALLSKFLMELNAKRLSGNITQEDEHMVRAVIPALGHTGRSEGRTALNSVRSSGWPPAVKKLAEEATKQLRN
ncbi:MAG: hypothetical protein LBG95_09130 [Treponema sp.]|jgi:hypothetical protein|nr:hypothetical protein [Treponema sp.]